MSNQTKVRDGEIYNVGNGFAISDEGGWLSGKYDSVESAELGLKNKSKNNWSYLEELTKKVNVLEDRNITVKDFK